MKLTQEVAVKLLELIPDAIMICQDGDGAVSWTADPFVKYDANTQYWRFDSSSLPSGELGVFDLAEDPVRAFSSPMPINEQFPKGTEVEVSVNGGIPWHRRYSAGELAPTTNWLQCYDDGATPWSTDGGMSSWKYVRAVTPPCPSYGSIDGGYFDNDQHRIDDIADEIHRLIVTNNSSKEDEYDDNIHRHFDENIINKFEDAVFVLRKASKMTQCIDRLLCGKDSPDSFKTQWEQELITTNK